MYETPSGRLARVRSSATSYQQAREKGRERMTPSIKRDERTWLVAIHSDACALKTEHGITECCDLLDESNDACTLENCPRKLAIGGYRLEEVHE
jgi:hypothetical protein